MSRAGQSTQKGITGQNWAALSLFLQYLKDPAFTHIQLEPDNSEDFDLVFGDGKKIICESKYRKEKFSYPQLKELLITIRERGSINDQDEILVVCRRTNEDFGSAVRNIKYYAPLKEQFKKKGFSDELISYVSKVAFWVVPQRFKGEDTNYSLITELLNIWVPAADVKRFGDYVLLNRIYAPSTEGGVYSRDDFDKDVNEFRKEVQARSDYFSDKIEKEKQFRKLERDIKSKRGIQWGSGSVSAFSARWQLMSFAMDRLKTRNDLDLSRWDDLWQLNKVYYFAFGIFRVFENNLQSEKNKKYVLSYIKKHVRDIRGFYRSDYFDVEVVKIITKIIGSDDKNDSIETAFEVVRDLLARNNQRFFYAKDKGYDRGKWEREEICKLLHQIYKRGNIQLKQEIFNLIIKSFNIVEDSGRFSHYAPLEVYEILREWLDEDLAGRSSKLIKVIGDQYDRSDKQLNRKAAFSGWEYSGGIIAYWGNDYQVTDRHFVIFVLAPLIKKLYSKDNNKGWRFVREECITLAPLVSKVRPDFLNRSVIEVVLDRYSKGDKGAAREAYGILKEFILSKKGIPRKSELVYQALVKFDMPDDKKWKLVEITSKKSSIPINPFVQTIVADLAKNDNRKAKAELAKWYAEPKYYGRSFFHIDPVTNIQALLDGDPDFAIALLQALMKSDYIKTTKDDDFGAYTVAGLLNDIIRKDYEKGLAILRALESEDKLNEDQQVIYCYSLFNSHGNDDSDDPKILSNLYKDIVDPFLSGLENDISKVCKRLPSKSCREAFVKFAARLATIKDIPAALRLIQIFANDPDPYLPGKDPTDADDKYSDHKKIEKGDEPFTITSVRGWCGWALIRCAVLEGRKQMSEIISLTEKLIDDENYYVVHTACSALARIARNRLTVLPLNNSELFLHGNKSKALKMAKKIEGLAFSLLKRFNGWPPLVQKAMAKSILTVFDPIRHLNEADSLKLVTALTRLSDEAMSEAASLFVYFAEYRKYDFKKWKFSSPGLYDDLGPDKYNELQFRKILIKTIKDLQDRNPEANFRFAASFEYIIRETLGNTRRDRKETKMVLAYFDLLANAYNHSVFGLIYQLINQKIGKEDENFDIWFGLLIKCLEVEKKFYDKNFISGKTTDMYWWPSDYNSEILESVYRRGGNDKFIKAAQIVFSFPNELDIHEKDNVISILKSFPKTDAGVRAIFKNLLERNPSKYWGLNN